MSVKNKMSRDARRAYVEELAIATVAIELADALAASGKSQRQVAEEIGVTEQRVSQILATKSNVTLRTLARFADAVGCELRIRFVQESLEVVRERNTWTVTQPYRPDLRVIEGGVFAESEWNEAA